MHNALIGIERARSVRLAPAARSSRPSTSRARSRSAPMAGQLRPRIHVRTRLYPVAELPHRPLPETAFRHAGQEPPARAGRARQARARGEFPDASTMHSLMELTSRRPASTTPNDFRPHHFYRAAFRRTEVMTLAQLYRRFAPGELFDGAAEVPVSAKFWAMADTESSAMLAQAAPDAIRDRSFRAMFATDDVLRPDLPARLPPAEVHFDAELKPSSPPRSPRSAARRASPPCSTASARACASMPDWRIVLFNEEAARHFQRPATMLGRILSGTCSRRRATLRWVRSSWK